MNEKNTYDNNENSHFLKGSRMWNEDAEIQWSLLHDREHLASYGTLKKNKKTPWLIVIKCLKEKKHLELHIYVIHSFECFFTARQERVAFVLAQGLYSGPSGSRMPAAQSLGLKDKSPLLSPSRSLGLRNEALTENKRRMTLVERYIASQAET